MVRKKKFWQVGQLQNRAINIESPHPSTCIVKKRRLCLFVYAVILFTVLSVWIFIKFDLSTIGDKRIENLNFVKRERIRALFEYSGMSQSEPYTEGDVLLVIDKVNASIFMELKSSSDVIATRKYLIESGFVPDNVHSKTGLPLPPMGFTHWKDRSENTMWFLRPKLKAERNPTLIAFDPDNLILHVVAAGRADADIQAFETRNLIPADNLTGPKRYFFRLRP